MKLSTLWNHDDFVNALLWVSIVGIVWYTLHPWFDPDFAAYGLNAVPYGSLWYILNPLFNNWQLYSVQVTAIQFPVAAIQWWLVRKGKISKELTVLTLFMSLLMRVANVNQDVTVIMFAPFVEISPLFTLLIPLQKFGIGWSWNLSDVHWQLFVGQILNPRFHPGLNGTTFVLPYYLLGAWTIVPLLFWLSPRLKAWKLKRKNKKYFKSMHCGDCISTGCEDEDCHCCHGGKGESKEFHLPTWLWNKDAERGVILGLIVALVGLGIFGTNDTSLLVDIKNGVLPYGVLWTWLNPYWWTQQPYMICVTAIECVMYGFQYWLVRKGRVSKDLVLMNLFTNVFLNATHVFQEGTVIMFGPLIAASPNLPTALVIIGVMILQKLPIGWSWNFQDPHVQCGIFGKCVVFYNSRLDIARSDFFTHLAIIFWVVAPLLIYWKRRTGKMPFLNQLNWMNRHRKLIFAIWVCFMICLTIIAVLRNGSFWTACVGSNGGNPTWLGCP